MNYYSKILQILEDSKDDFKKVMRYRGNGWIVPQEIETETKEAIRNREGESGKKDFGKFIVSRDEIGFSVQYQGHIYKEVPESGNIYDHMITQDIFLKKYLQYDLASGIISQDEYNKLLILNLRHDQPEGVTGDITVYAKSQKNYDDEDKVAHKLIDMLPYLNDKEKDDLHNINNLQENAQGIFKLYERLRYIEDVILLYNHKNFFYNAKHVCIISFFTALKKTQENILLPNGDILYGLNFASTKKVFADKKSQINEIIERCKDYNFQKESDKENRILSLEIRNNLFKDSFI